MTPFFQFIALLLVPLMVRVPLSAQSIVQNAAGLRIRELPQSPGQNTLAVVVTDTEGVPAPGVAVTFRMPEDGPAGVFADGSRIAVVSTDTSGQAQVTGIRWTAAEAASVRVTATKGTEHAGILLEHQAEITQPNATPKLASKSTPPPPITAAVSKPMAAEQPPSSQAKPPQPVAAATKPPVTAISPKAAPKEVAAVPTSPAMTAPAIEPPHVSITSVSRKQPVPGQVSDASPSSGVEPSVAITGAGERNHGGSKKWIILALIAAGAGAGAAVMLSRGKSGAASTTSTSGLSIGAPSISIGAP
jgi:hypothetical protein